MRLLLAVSVLAACSDDPEARIIVPLPDTTIVASVELRMEGHQLSDTTETKIYIDLQHYTGELIANTLPDDCDDCSFVISFAGAPIANGPHTIGAYFFAGDKQIATDSIPVVFQR
jgi:hypothetical protein